MQENDSSAYALTYSLDSLDEVKIFYSLKRCVKASLKSEVSEEDFDYSVPFVFPKPECTLHKLSFLSGEVFLCLCNFK